MFPSPSYLGTEPRFQGNFVSEHSPFLHCGARSKEISTPATSERRLISFVKAKIYTGHNDNDRCGSTVCTVPGGVKAPGFDGGTDIPGVLVVITVISIHMDFQEAGTPTRRNKT
jgi:hypothetical protein